MEEGFSPLRNSREPIHAVENRIHELEIQIEESRRNHAEILHERDILRNIAETVPSGVVQLDDQGVFVYVNRGAEHLIGLPREKLIGRSFDSRRFRIRTMSGDPITLQSASVLDFIKCPRSILGKWVMLDRPDGTSIAISLSTAPVQDPDGNPGGVIFSFNDITNRMQAEENLRQNEEKFRQYIESSPLGVHVYALEPDDQLVFVDYNPVANRILGIDCAKYIGMPLEKAFPSLAETDIPKHYREVARNGGGWRGEQVSYRDGQIDGVYEVNAYCVPPNRAAILFSDITERVRMEHQRRQYECILSVTDDMMSMVNSNYVYEATNEAYIRIFGKPREEIVGHHVSDLFGQEMFESFLKPLLDRCLAGEEIRYESWLACPDGQDRYMSIVYYPFREDEGKPTAIAVCRRDITERKREEDARLALEQRIQEAQKLESMGVMAGGIAHDFNNLLMMILGNVELALQDISPVSPARPSLEEIERASRRAADLCRQMLAYSGRGKFVILSLDLSEVVEEMTHILQVSLSKKAVLHIDCKAGLPPIDADPTQIRQVIVNIVANASEALGDRSGTISIRTGMMHCDREYLKSTHLDEDRSEGNFVYLEVSDTGCGMEEPTTRRIFDPFFTTKFMGRGLGLPAVFGIVRGHKGAVKVYTEKDRGTTVKVLFPISKCLSIIEEIAEVSNRPAWKGKGTVLLVDDEESICTVCRKMLERLGFAVLEATNGREAIETFISHRDEISIVLLDLMMPIMNGDECYRELRRIDTDVPVIISSGYNQQEVSQRFVGKGVGAFIQKPYQRKALEEALQTVMGEDVRDYRNPIRDTPCLRTRR
jgi:two-component system cell cycle sensor histidine kinase/response regulator CckA